MTEIPSLSSIEDARQAIIGAAIRTPLVRLNVDDAPCEVHLKLENLQPIGSFKIRGAANRIRSIPREELKQGVLTASAGNMAQGAAWMAREIGVPCTVIAPETAPLSKLSAIERLGARTILVPFDEWWQTFERRSYPGVSGVYIHAFDDLAVIAGNGTIGLEVLEDLSDVEAIVIPWGGGGLTCGIASAVRALKHDCKIYAAEVETAAPLKPSLLAGSPQSIDYKSSFVDGIGGRAVFPSMFERAKQLVDDSLIATLDEIQSAIKLLVERNHVVAEGAGACPVACALAGKAGSGKVVCIVSGGNIDPGKLCGVLVHQS